MSAQSARQSGRVPGESSNNELTNPTGRDQGRRPPPVGSVSSPRSVPPRARADWEPTGADQPRLPRAWASPPDNCTTHERTPDDH